eukprot:TRINITY_DN1499_c0_g1_i7.p1 TRINITY_DN1499_c0_g1~~TRINITY_DN1499_c0_g1_i7.p1  ORF type:complete len:383 (-),score=-0.65 TRINITY_DN1499_c0_g1_i7:279-1352(-)
MISNWSTKLLQNLTHSKFLPLQNLFWLYSQTNTEQETENSIANFNMGQGLSITARVQFDNYAVCPGQALCGTITAYVTDYIPTCNQLTLLVLGSILTQITNGDQQKQEVLRLMVPLALGEFHPGVIQRRFQVTLPQNLPPTFNYDRVNQKAKVEYKVEVFAETTRIGASAFKVLSPMALNLDPLEIFEDELSVGACCCFTPAYVQVHATLDKSQAYAGDTLRIDYEAYNKSKMKFNNVEIYLKQQVRVKAQSHVKYAAERHSRRQMPGDFSQYIKLPLQVRVPLTLTVPTVQTPLFSCEYQIIIGLGTGCGQGCITIPLQVYFRHPMLGQNTGQRFNVHEQQYGENSQKVAIGLPIY